MAVDTRDKRAAALREGLLPLPDGLPLDAGDRQQVLWQYRLASEPPATILTGTGKQFIGEIQQLGLSDILDASMGIT